MIRVAVVVAFFMLVAPDPVQACGGFFCNANPVDQTGEQIVFSIDDKGVTATIRILYTGNAKDFAWVVPVMSKPTIRIGALALFTTLRNATQPRFNLDLGILGSCGGRGGPTAGGVPGNSAPPPSAPGVQVVEMKEVGPYASVILESNNAAELIAWLNTNGYDQPASSTPLIEHYVKQSFLFVALKLKQDAAVGEIQPLELEMSHGEACVPLVLTQVAARPNMPVQIFVLGKQQAAPRNWFQVDVNLRRLDWLNGGPDYQTLLSAAVDEAAGHGFVTEFANRTPSFTGALYVASRYDVAAIRAATDPVEILSAISRSSLPFDATLLALLRKYIPKPAALSTVPDIQFYSNISLYRSALGNLQVDGAAFAAELDERVLGPLRRGQEMLDRQPYLTRLYSTVSPNEMNRDPFFHFNAELPNVSNVHTARAVSGACHPQGGLLNLVVELDSGERVALTNQLGVALNGSPSVASLPAASRIALVGKSGPASIYTAAQAQTVDQALNRDTPEMVRIDHPGRLATTGGSGCHVGQSGRPLASVLTLAFLAMLAARARRRR